MFGRWGREGGTRYGGCGKSLHPPNSAQQSCSHAGSWVAIRGAQADWGRYPEKECLRKGVWS